MAYDEGSHKKSRVVIETPTARREVEQTTTARVPERRGISMGVVAALVIGSVALVTILFLYILNRQNNDTTANTNLRTTTTTAQTPLPQPVIVQQATPLPQQPPIIIQQPAPTTSQPPLIIEQPAPATASSGTTTTTSKPSGTDDTTIQSEIDKRVAQDATLSTVAVTATVNGGKVTLIGTVDTPAIKNQYERLVRAVKGVKSIDDQIVVSGG